MISDDQLSVYFARCMLYGGLLYLVAYVIVMAVGLNWWFGISVFIAAGILMWGTAKIAAAAVNDRVARVNGVRNHRK